MKKTTLATLVGAAAFAAAGVANATIVVGGDNGYEFSVDGNINQFYIYSDQDASGGGGQDNSQLANGLLPVFFGFNVKAPEINGLTVGARVSISPSTNNGSYVEAGGVMEQREAFGTVNGAFGQILMGKALGLYSANNILLDQTLFGVGATSFTAAGNQNTGQTSLGGIGWGYEYAYWRSQIRWTSNDMGGFQIALAIVDNDTTFMPLPVAEKDPRYEASLSYASAFDGGSFKLWLDGMTSEVEFADGNDERANAYTLGAQIVLGGFEVVAAYYDSEGQGLAGLGGLGAYDRDGSAREGDGYYVQAGYRFGGQTFVAASYGESALDRDNSTVDNGYGDGFEDFDKNSRITVGVYHDVTANLKLVAEYSQLETEYHSGISDDEVDVFSVGGFITW